MYRGDRTVTGRSGRWAVVACLFGATLLAVAPATSSRSAAFAEPAAAVPSDSAPVPAPDPAATPTVPATGAPTAPALDPTAVPTPSTQASSAPAPASTSAPVPAPAPEPAVPQPAPDAHGAVVDHYVLAPVPDAGSVIRYGRTDDPIADAARLDTFRIRFRLHNASAQPITISPRLEFRPDVSAAYGVVPVEPKPGVAVHLTREWVPSPGRDGKSVQGPPEAELAVTDLMLGGGSSEPVVAGERSTAANPARQLSLPAGAATEQEFTVRMSIDAAFDTAYQLRLTDAGAALDGGVATIRLGAKPPLRLSPGQQQGTDVTGTGTTGGGGRGIAYRLVAMANVRQAAAIRTLNASAVGPSAIHGPYSMTADECGVCHRGHAAEGPNLLTKPGPTSTLCFTCHDGSGAADVLSQYTDATVPPDDPTQREYYRHDSLAPSTHALAQDNEFGGVSNRHADCADCHNPHQAAGAESTPTATGWTSSGALAGTSGVAVTNHAAGVAPDYTFLNGVTNPVSLEYQLCLKCHSGFTQLPSNGGLSPSRFELDKGIEFNPANASYHPVEAPGTNATTQMTGSLEGTSPYKLWNFTVDSTVRCTGCHAGGQTATGSGTPPGAGGDQQSHASSYRGILIRNYRDRVLLSAGESYSPANFALCLVCHGEAPYLNDSGGGTNFRYHALHLTDLKGKGSGGTDIDTAGDGQGNAVCAECHFRLHSTSFKVGDQAVDGSRLVNFAPNVTGTGGAGTAPEWTRTGAGGSCALTCHGKKHDPKDY